MNNVILLGRLTKDIELRQTSGGKAYTRFCLAVERKYKDANGNKTVDFINCVAWGQTAGMLAKFYQKGSKMLVEGSIMTSSYSDANGNTKSMVEINVSSVPFIDSKPKAETQDYSARPETKGRPVQPAPVAPDMNSGSDFDFGLPY